MAADLNTSEPTDAIRWPTPGEVITNGANQYLVGEVLGRGGYATTFACSDQWQNALVLKVIAPQGYTYEQVQHVFQRELTNLVRLRHPNITYVFDAFELSRTFHIVMERCDATIENLFMIPNYDGYAWVYPIARCVLQGIGYMHDNGYVHKDMHLRNIFWQRVRNELTPSDSQSVTFKIGDLGISRLEWEINPQRTTIAPWMYPPEFLNSAQFGTVGRATDIYHAGLVLLAVVLGIEPSFTNEEILNGVPSQTAAQLRPPIGPAIARALTRHVAYRTQSAIQFWRDLNNQLPPPMAVPVSG